MIIIVKHCRTEINADWRVNALKYLEPYIRYFSLRYQYRDMAFEDYYQELWLHLWNKLEKYEYTDKAQIHTWASVVIRKKCIDIWRVRNKAERTRLRKEKK